LAGSALARSTIPPVPTVHVIGTVNGKTTQKGGTISPVFDVNAGRFVNAGGTFRCDAHAAKRYEFVSNGLPREDQAPFQLGRRFTFRLSERWKVAGQVPVKRQRYQKGKVKVTITGTITEHPSSLPGIAASVASGHGSVSFTAPGCSTGKLSWSGTGPIVGF
jgi:hypothetical protein